MNDILNLKELSNMTEREQLKRLKKEISENKARLKKAKKQTTIDALENQLTALREMSYEFA